MFAVNMSGTAAASVVGKVNKAYASPDGTTDPAVTGRIMAISTTVPCFFAVIFYYIAGKYYKEWKE